MPPTMLLKIKTMWIVVSAIAALCLPSCSPSSGLPKSGVLNTAAPSPQNLKTTMGDFLITSVRLVDEVHGEKSQPGDKFLLVILTQPGVANLIPGEFSLESFQNMIRDSHGQIYVLGNDDSPTISTMAGWVQDEFVMGFRVPMAESYTLYWPGNSPIELNPKGQ
ncbi:MAG TPA: hypothetical protein VK206_05685 [Anaerolineales bacterium]|nr:hypothetical protein [Anaerolineales bacterium]